RWPARAAAYSWSRPRTTTQTAGLTVCHPSRSTGLAAPMLAASLANPWMSPNRPISAVPRGCDVRREALLAVHARHLAEADMKRGILIWIALLIVLPPPAGGAPKFS